MKRWIGGIAAALAAGVAVAQDAAPAWQWAGWGGGGFFFSAVFHPAKDGTLYLGGDVAGVYKSQDHGRTWRMINNGIADYAIYGLAVDRTAPDTVYAATEGGLCKSVDGGAQWRLLPKTGPKELRITGERMKSIRSVAVDPTDGNVVYAGSPGGKVFKSTDGGGTWRAVYEKSSGPDPRDALRVQFGKVNDGWHGGFWLPLKFPADAKAAACSGFGFTFQGDGTLPRDCFLTLKTTTGATYRSRNLREVFQQKTPGEVVLGAKDFVLDPDYAKSHPDETKAYTGTPDWAAVNRMDFVCVGPLMNEAPVGFFSRLFFVVAGAAPERQIVRDFARDPALQAYGNVRVGAAQGGTVYSVTVAAKDPKLVIAATEGAGLVASRDAGATWRELDTPKAASSVVVAESDPNTIFATFLADGVRASSDGGRTWKDVSQTLPKGLSAIEVAVSPADPRDVYLIATAGWNGRFFRSENGGESWSEVSQLAPDASANPTLANEYHKTTQLSAPRNLAINPLNPKELFIAANWRPCLSEDGGRTWTERVRGADISCIYDLRFHKGRTYAAAMDEGVLVSEDRGANWRQLWPLKYDAKLGGHYWRLAIADHNGVDRIVSTCSSWNTQYPGFVVLSEDGGKNYTSSEAGLPAGIPHANTMWGNGSPRALAVDPKDPQTLYLGIDGDPVPGEPAGGVFRSRDGGRTWAALPGQPASRRMFFGLAVDPTDSKRLYWGACGAGGGVYRSEDAGATWQHVFKNESWVFNLHVAADGTVYCPGNNLWRSSDHGATWTQLTKFPFTSRVIVAIETDPADAKRMWFAATTWGNAPDGGVFETRDGGATWQEITGDLPYRKPILLRYNPDTRELWAAGVCLFKCRR